MREILFRGKIVNNKEWVYGYLYITHDKEYEIGYYSKETNVERMTHIVMPETVGQYIGLEDKNGTKIFEGDIVLTQEYYTRPYSDKSKKKRLTGIVEYRDRVFNGNEQQTLDIELRVEIVNKEDREKYSFGVWSDFFDCEVIGNIHDNPELIEKH